MKEIMSSLFYIGWTRCRELCWLLLGQHKQRENKHAIPKSHTADQLFILLDSHRCLTSMELLLVSTLFVLPAWQRSLVMALGPHRGQPHWVDTKNGTYDRDLPLRNRLWTKLSQLMGNIYRPLQLVDNQCPSPQACGHQHVLTPTTF